MLVVARTTSNLGREAQLWPCQNCDYDDIVLITKHETVTGNVKVERKVLNCTGKMFSHGKNTLQMKVLLCHIWPRI